MKAKDVMTPRVISVRQDATVLEAAGLMLQNQISGLPVVNAAGELVGMVTEGDFLRRAEIDTERHRPRWLEIVLGPGRAAENFTRSNGRKVAEVMSAEPYTITEDTPLDEIVSLMERHRIKRLPVTREGKPVGIVSRANLMRAMFSLARAIPSPTLADADIRGRILAEMQSQIWAPVSMVDVTVSKGVVDLWGTILDERDRQALTVLAENVPGVKAVKDHLVWVEPFSGLAIAAGDSDASDTVTKTVA
jgi:CBS domain-containing protein